VLDIRLGGWVERVCSGMGQVGGGEGVEVGVLVLGLLSVKGTLTNRGRGKALRRAGSF
jgi:hypothetical protein